MDAKTEADIRKSMTSEQILLERKLTCEAINGAMAFGYQNTNPPPSDDHWLAPFWKIGRKQAELEAAALAHSDAAQAPYAYEIGAPGGEQTLAYAAYLERYATEEERALPRLALYAAPVAPAAAAQAITDAARDVLAERERQISKEGWSTMHDDEHDSGEMADAAAAYALHASGWADRMPRIAGEDSPAGQKAAEHAYLLTGLDDNSTECWGDQILSYVGTMNREHERLGVVLGDAGCTEDEDYLEFIEKLAARAASPQAKKSGGA